MFSKSILCIFVSLLATAVFAQSDLASGQVPKSPIDKWSFGLSFGLTKSSDSSSIEFFTPQILGRGFLFGVGYEDIAVEATAANGISYTPSPISFSFLSLTYQANTDSQFIIPYARLRGGIIDLRDLSSSPKRIGFMMGFGSEFLFSSRDHERIAAINFETGAEFSDGMQADLIASSPAVFNGYYFKMGVKTYF